MAEKDDLPKQIRDDRDVAQKNCPADRFSLLVGVEREKIQKMIAEKFEKGPVGSTQERERFYHLGMNREGAAEGLEAAATRSGREMRS